MGEGRTRYFGKVCLKHPELNGEQTFLNYCVGCRLDADRKRRKNPKRREQNRQWLRQLRKKPEYAAKMRELDRLRKHTVEHRAWDRARKKRPATRAQRRARYATDPQHAILVGARTRIGAALVGKEKSARTLALLGVDTIGHYKSHLESQFELGMTWENYGAAWHVDHRIPVSLFNLSKPEEQRLCFNYKNTRPMWAAKNISRGNRIVFEDLL